LDYLKSFTNFFKFKGNQPIHSQVMGIDIVSDLNCNSSSAIKQISYPIQTPLNKSILAVNLLNDLLKRVFTDGLELIELKGISKNLIEEGILYDYFIDYMKSNTDYKIYIKKLRNEIIAMNKDMVDETFEELIVKPVSTRYYSMLAMFEVLANYIISAYKESEISNFFIFKKDGYNSLFDFKDVEMSNQYQDMQKFKVNYFTEQLDNLEASLKKTNKESIVLIDVKDDLKLLEVKYENIEKNLDNIYKLISLVSGLPDNYLTGTFKSGLGDSHSGELEATNKGILSFLKSESIPFLRALGIKTEQTKLSIFQKIRNNIDLINALPEEKKNLLFDEKVINNIKNEMFK